MPFYSSDDRRLVKLETKFLKYIDDWHNQVEREAQRLPNKSKKEKKKMLNMRLSDETYEALRFTTISTIHSIRHLLENEKFGYVLSLKMTNDDVERFFSSIRQSMGGNHQGDAWSAATAFEKSVRTGLVRASLSCNVDLEKEKERDYKLIVESGSTKKRAKSVLDSLPTSLTSPLKAELSRRPSTRIVAYIISYQLLITFLTIRDASPKCRKCCGCLFGWICFVYYGRMALLFTLCGQPPAREVNVSLFIVYQAPR